MEPGEPRESNRKTEMRLLRRNHLSLSLFFIPPILLLAALDFEKPASPSVRVVDIPFEACEVGFSGEACLTMYLQSRGHEISQEQVFRRARIDVAEGRSCRAD